VAVLVAAEYVTTPVTGAERLSTSVKLAVLMVEWFMASSNVAVRTDVVGTFVALLRGLLAVTWGGVVSGTPKQKTLSFPPLHPV